MAQFTNLSNSQLKDEIYGLIQTRASRLQRQELIRLLEASDTKSRHFAHKTNEIIRIFDNQLILFRNAESIAFFVFIWRGAVEHRLQCARGGSVRTLVQVQL